MVRRCCSPTGGGGKGTRGSQTRCLAEPNGGLSTAPSSAPGGREGFGVHRHGDCGHLCSPAGGSGAQHLGSAGEHGSRGSLQIFQLKALLCQGSGQSSDKFVSPLHPVKTQRDASRQADTDSTAHGSPAQHVHLSAGRTRISETLRLVFTDNHSQET